MDGWGTLGDDNIPSWLFWPVCLPLDHQHQSDWISTFFLKKRIGLHLAYCFSSSSLTQHSRWRLGCEERKEKTAKRCVCVCVIDDDEACDLMIMMIMKYVQLQVPFCCVCACVFLG